MEDPNKYQSTRMRSFIRFVIQKVGCRNFFVSKSKKISFSKINLLNLRKNLVGPWGSTQLGERSPKPVSPPKSDTRKVSPPSSPQNRPTCTCSTLPRASARQPPLTTTANLSVKAGRCSLASSCAKASSRNSYSTYRGNLGT